MISALPPGADARPDRPPSATVGPGTWVCNCPTPQPDQIDMCLRCLRVVAELVRRRRMHTVTQVGVDGADPVDADTELSA